MSETNKKICPCCGNLSGCDCYSKQSPQYRRVKVLEAALKPLYEACLYADANEDLPEAIDGSLLDAARSALSTDAGKKLLEELNRLKNAVAWCYQYVGGTGGSVAALDQLSALAQGEVPATELEAPFECGLLEELEELRKLKHAVDEWLDEVDKAYSTDFFQPLDKTANDRANTLLKAAGIPRDCLSADMGRHMVKWLRRNLDAAKEVDDD